MSSPPQGFAPWRVNGPEFSATFRVQSPAFFVAIGDDMELRSPFVILGCGILALIFGCATQQKIDNEAMPSKDESEVYDATCPSWVKLSDDERFIVIGSALEKNVGHPKGSFLAACMWSKINQIEIAITWACSFSEKNFNEAIGFAFDTSIEECLSEDQ